MTQERTLTVEVPAGSRRRGYQTYTVQDLVLAPQLIRFRRERWVTPEGLEIVAPLPPEVTGHFGPGVARFILMQHVQGQVTVERLLNQLTSLGLRISKGQIIALLNHHKDAFHLEKDSLLEAFPGTDLKGDRRMDRLGRRRTRAVGFPEIAARSPQRVLSY